MTFENSEHHRTWKVMRRSSLVTALSSSFAGKWGNGQDRKDRLTAAGYIYSEIQNRVNELMGSNKPTKSVDQLAHEVIHGLWENGQDRKNRLTAAGYDYSAVQTRINELLK